MFIFVNLHFKKNLYPFGIFETQVNCLLMCFYFKVHFVYSIIKRVFDYINNQMCAELEHSQEQLPRQITYFLKSMTISFTLKGEKSLQLNHDIPLIIIHVSSKEMPKYGGICIIK